MLKLTGIIRQKTVIKKALDAAISRGLSEAVRVGALAFVHAVADSIPVYTGMAKATLRPLAFFLNEDVIINSKVSFKNASDYPRSVGEGMAKGFVLFKNGPKLYSMTFDHSVFHLWLNRQFSITKVASSPWNSYELGTRAFFKAFSRKIIELKIPPSAYIRIKVTKI